ncbi:MAG: hypothetical protein WA715_19765 [Candidatus Acidiferrum sp.]
MPESVLLAEPHVQAPDASAAPMAIPSGRSNRTWYWLAVFLSAFLLFQVQLIVGKYILPFFGGTPSVWNTCMLCFQFLLLTGYAYAHVLGRARDQRTQGKIHASLLIFSVAVVAVLWVRWGSPLTPGASWRPAPEDNPVWKILELLFATVALPFFVLSATGPLLQNWYRPYATNGYSPYRLYAISNAGSLLGLLSYPFLIEWAFNIRHQARVWASGYVAFAILCSAIGWRLSRNRAEHVADGKRPDNPVLSQLEKPGVGRYLLWIGLAACSTTMLLATTNLICQDLAVIPLLWALPLCLYLASFILAFSPRRWYRRSVFWPLYFLALGSELTTNLFGFHLQTPTQIVMLSGALFVVCMVCHGELSLSKPAPRYLTSFYLMVAGGGVIGGIFVVLMAPNLFLGFWEFHIGLIGCGLLLFAAFVAGDPRGRSEPMLWRAALLIQVTFLITNLPNIVPSLARWSILSRPEVVGLPMAAIGLIWWVLIRNTPSSETPASRFPWQPATAVGLTAIFGILVFGYVRVRASQILFQERNFYGIKSVINEEEHIGLLSGSTLHGRQFKNPAARDIPLTYYRTESGIGLLLRNYPRTGSGNLRVGVIGMGAGTLAIYGRRGDYYRFYEIDPAMIDLSAGTPPYFTFVHDSQAKIDAVLGDARISLERELKRGQKEQFDVLVVDAFSSDSIPVHLLTDEALEVYLEHLRSGGSVIAFHITNHFLDLAPVLAALAESHGLTARQVRNEGSTWVLLAADPQILQLPGLMDKSTPLILARKPVLWTDGYSNLFQVVRRPGA